MLCLLASVQAVHGQMQDARRLDIWKAVRRRSSPRKQLHWQCRRKCELARGWGDPTSLNHPEDLSYSKGHARSHGGWGRDWFARRLQGEKQLPGREGVWFLPGQPYWNRSDCRALSQASHCSKCQFKSKKRIKFFHHSSTSSSNVPGMFMRMPSPRLLCPPYHHHLASHR